MSGTRETLGPRPELPVIGTKHVERDIMTGRLRTVVWDGKDWIHDGYLPAHYEPAFAALRARAEEAEASEALYRRRTMTTKPLFRVVDAETGELITTRCQTDFAVRLDGMVMDVWADDEYGRLCPCECPNLRVEWLRDPVTGWLRGGM